MTKSKAKKSNSTTQAKEPTKKIGRSKSKQQAMIALLQRAQGATMDELVKATGWQKHTVRGAISGSLRKRLKLRVALVQTDKGGAYRIQA